MTTRTPGSSDLYTSISALSRQHNMRLSKHIKWIFDVARLTVYLPMWSNNRKIPIRNLHLNSLFILALETTKCYVEFSACWKNILITQCHQSLNFLHNTVIQVSRESAIRVIGGIAYKKGAINVIRLAAILTACDIVQRRKYWSCRGIDFERDQCPIKDNGKQLSQALKLQDN